MKPTHIAIAATAVALLALGALAGSVIGDDGAVEVSERIDGSAGEPVREVARPLQPQATTAGKKKRAKKPQVQHGVGQTHTLPPGQAIAVALVCPRKFPVPISAGFDSTGTGVVANVLTRHLSAKRAMLIAVVNTAAEPRDFRATAACMKGVKET